MYQFDQLLWYSCLLNHSPSCHVLSKVCLKSMKLMTTFRLCSMLSSSTKYLSYCEELIDYASSWPETGLLLSKCSFNTLFLSVLYQFGEVFPWNALRANASVIFGAFRSPFLLYIGTIVYFDQSSEVFLRLDLCSNCFTSSFKQFRSDSIYSWSFIFRLSGGLLGSNKSNPLKRIRSG